MQKALIKPYTEPKERTQFWDDYLNNDFSYIAKKYGYVSMKSKVRLMLNMLKWQMKRR